MASVEEDKIQGSWVKDTIKEINQGGTKASIAYSYAMAFKMGVCNEDVVILNKHIMKHWDKDTLIKIKNYAWDLIEGKIKTIPDF